MKKALLSVFAHPDDESFGPGGTLARYAAEGVDVHVAIATDGAVGSVEAGYEAAQSDLVGHRLKELDEATRILGVTLHRLGYRDSGMSGSPTNDHPNAWIQADEREAVAKIVRLIREIQPQVVITHDETGGYFHPDHIFCWKMTTAAFHAAGDPSQYPELGLPPYQPQRLYYTAFSNRLLKLLILVMRLRRADPTKVGRNKDIDLTRLGLPPRKIHAYIDYRDYWEVKGAASRAHGSQGGGTEGFMRFIPLWLRKRLLSKESFQRALPPVQDGFKERDLFNG